MSEDFLLIVGNGWVELPNATQWIDGNIGEEGVQQMINGMEWSNLSNFMEASGIIGENQVIQGARLINTTEPANRLRFWYIPPVTP